MGNSVVYSKGGRNYNNNTHTYEPITSQLNNNNRHGRTASSKENSLWFLDLFTDNSSIVTGS